VDGIMIVNGELEGMWKEICVISLRYCPRICLEGKRKTMGSLSDNNSLSPNSKPRSLEYKAAVLITQPRHNTE